MTQGVLLRSSCRRRIWREDPSQPVACLSCSKLRLCQQQQQPINEPKQDDCSSAYPIRPRPVMQAIHSTTQIDLWCVSLRCVSSC